MVARPDAAAPPARRTSSLVAARRRRLRAASAATAPRSPRRPSTRSPRDGLRYTNFHTTPLCSPTRACLLTGRNHHSVGMALRRRTADSGFPATRGHDHQAGRRRSPRSCAPHGYTTLRGRQVAPRADRRDARRPGRTTSWPLGRGFDRFYGFLDGDDRPVLPRRSSTTTTASTRRTSPSRATTSPRTWSTTRSSFVRDQVSASARASRSSSTSRSARAHCAAPGAAGVPRQVPRPLRRRAGT